MTTRLPIHIPDPCSESWQEMSGDGSRRHCARCDQHVHDLLALPAAAARRVLESGACVRLDLGRLARRVAPVALLTVALSGCATTGPIEVTPTTAPYNGEAPPPETDVDEPDFVEEAGLLDILQEAQKNRHVMGVVRR